MARVLAKCDAAIPVPPVLPRVDKFSTGAPALTRRTYLPVQVREWTRCHSRSRRVRLRVVAGARDGGRNALSNRRACTGRRPVATQVSAHRFLHECDDPCLFGGGRYCLDSRSVIPYLNEDDHRKTSRSPCCLAFALLTKARPASIRCSARGPSKGQRRRKWHELPRRIRGRLWRHRRTQGSVDQSEAPFRVR